MQFDGLSSGWSPVAGADAWSALAEQAIDQAQAGLVEETIVDRKHLPRLDRPNVIDDLGDFGPRRVNLDACVSTRCEAPAAALRRRRLLGRRAGRRGLLRLRLRLRARRPSQARGRPRVLPNPVLRHELLVCHVCRCCWSPLPGCCARLVLEGCHARALADHSS